MSDHWREAEARRQLDRYSWHDKTMQEYYKIVYWPREEKNKENNDDYQV